LIDDCARAIEPSVEYLASPAAAASLERDPYWPKWDSPWWHMALLGELGRAAQIPARALDTLVDCTNRHYVKVFPIQPEDVPAGLSLALNSLCHCAVGTLFQFLHGAGREPDTALPWLRPWILRYQLADGGLNCNEDAYLKENGRSSMLSTLPALEAVLHCTPREFTAEEVAFLDRGAAYLIAHRLARSARTGAVIREHWFAPCFPRFYEYDVLRGLDWLTAWAERLDRPLPWSAIEESVAVLEQNAASGAIFLRREWLRDEGSLVPRPDRTWARERTASLFPLLEAVSAKDTASPVLTERWTAARQRIEHLRGRGRCA
jgi:hypothetical protein